MLKEKALSKNLYKPFVRPGVTMEHPLNVAVISVLDDQLVMTCDWHRQSKKGNYPVISYSHNSGQTSLLSSEKLTYLGDNFMLPIRKGFSLEPILRQAIGHLMSQFFMPKKNESFMATLDWDKKRYILEIKHAKFGVNLQTCKEIFASYVSSALLDCERGKSESLMVDAICHTDSFSKDYVTIAEWSKKLRSIN